MERIDRILGIICKGAVSKSRSGRKAGQLQRDWTNVGSGLDGSAVFAAWGHLHNLRC